MQDIIHHFCFLRKFLFVVDSCAIFCIFVNKTFQSPCAMDASHVVSHDFNFNINNLTLLQTQVVTDIY